MLKRYEDLLAAVRWDGKYHSVRQLITPGHPTVQSIANTLIQRGNFANNCQDFVNQFTTYTDELGDYWGTPVETLESQSEDCDGKSILLCSLLRNYYPPDKVFCAVGLWNKGGDDGGHMWVMLNDNKNINRIVESTAGSDHKLYGNYRVLTLFNDEYALSSEAGIKEFDFIPVPLGVIIPAEKVSP